LSKSHTVYTINPKVLVPTPKETLYVCNMMLGKDLQLTPCP